MKKYLLNVVTVHGKKETAVGGSTQIWAVGPLTNKLPFLDHASVMNVTALPQAGASQVRVTALTDLYFSNSDFHVLFLSQWLHLILDEISVNLTKM